VCVSNRSSTAAAAAAAASSSANNTNALESCIASMLMSAVTDESIDSIHLDGPYISSFAI
jgi:hypothetical protein